MKLLLSVNQLLFRTIMYHSCDDIQDLFFIFISNLHFTIQKITRHPQTANETVLSPDRVYSELYHIGWSLYHNSQQWRRPKQWGLGTVSSPAESLTEITNTQY